MQMLSQGLGRPSLGDETEHLQGVSIGRREGGPLPGLLEAPVESERQAVESPTADKG